MPLKIIKTYLDSQQLSSNMQWERKAFTFFFLFKRIAFSNVIRPWHLCLS